MHYGGRAQRVRGSTALLFPEQRFPLWRLFPPSSRDFLTPKAHLDRLEPAVTVTDILLLAAASSVIALWFRPVRNRAREQLISLTALAWTQLGPMSPAKCAKLVVEHTVRNATATHTERVVPNDIAVDVAGSDYDSWGPLAQRLPQQIVAALGARVTEKDDLVLLPAAEGVARVGAR